MAKILKSNIIKNESMSPNEIYFSNFFPGREWRDEVKNKRPGDIKRLVIPIFGELIINRQPMLMNFPKDFFNDKKLSRSEMHAEPSSSRLQSSKKT